MKEFKPNLFILGVAKSGTTALHEYLDSIDGVCMSNPKEPYFFECEFDQGLDFYRSKYFEHWTCEKIIGESRHRNLYLPYVAERIKEVSPRAKLIVILRDPAERAFSHWWHFYSRGQENLGFREAILSDIERIESGSFINDDETIEEYCQNVNGFLNGVYRTYVDTGYYYEQLNRYLEHFRKEDLLILKFEHLRTQEEAIISQLADFVGLSKENMPPKIISSNEKKIVETDSSLRKLLRTLKITKLIPVKYKEAFVKRKSEKIRDDFYDAEIINLLREHFAPHNDRLQELIDFDIHSWYL